MGMVVAESSIPVSSLVQEFNKIGKSKFETEKSLIIECEIEIKGIVKKVVKFFNEFAERNIQSKGKKEKKRKLKERLKKRRVDEEQTGKRIRPEVIPEDTLPTYTSPELQWRNSIRLPIPEWDLMGGRRDIKQKNGKNLKLSSPAEWYNEARYNLRKNMPGDIIYEKRDLFKALPDHVLLSIFSQLGRRDLFSLKRVCRDFDWLITYYDVVAPDSGWRTGVKYLEDRCKYCKRKRQPGDSSICRYHPKKFIGDPCSYNQFYMCCRSQIKNSPGCVIRDRHDNYLTVGLANSPSSTSIRSNPSKLTSSI